MLTLLNFYAIINSRKENKEKDLMKRMKVCPDCKRCIFFTLIELLIVIAIISIT